MPPRPSPAGAHPLAALALAGASLVAAAAVGSTFLSTARDSWAAIVAAGPADPGDGILLVVALGGALLSMWLGLGMALSALSALPGALGQACDVLADRLAPATARKVVAFVLGTTLTAALVPVSAIARTGLASPRPARVAVAQMARGGLADAAPSASFGLVSDALSAKDAAPSPSWSPEKGSTDGVTVQTGDTLWSIAARHLGPGATSAAIDAEWHRWFATNREVIGADANVIAPGQRLDPPAAQARS